MRIDKLALDFGNAEIDYDTSDDHYTPPHIFKALGVEFDMDVCAPAGGLSWIPAKKSLSIIDDGLTANWSGRVWMNPPYSGIKPWCQKMVDHGNGIALLLFSRNQLLNLVWEASDGVMMLDANMKFIRSDGTTRSIMAHTGLFAFGSENRQILEASGLGKVR